MSARVAMATLSLLLLAACGGVSSFVAKDVPAPHTIAVLPFVGSADAGARELARSLFAARLGSAGFRVADRAAVDALLAERGWLADPEAFARAALPVREVAAALGVDAVLVADRLDASSFNLVLFRRQTVGGTVHLYALDGAEWWRADYTVSVTGGLLLQSGQVLTELRAQGQHGTPMATVALVDQFVEDAAGTVPAPVGTAAAAPALQLQAVHVVTESADAPRTRLVVTAQASPRARLAFDVGTAVTGVPMAAVPGATGALQNYRGAIDLDQPGLGAAIAVHAYGAFGDHLRAEAQQP